MILSQNVATYGIWTQVLNLLDIEKKEGRSKAYIKKELEIANVRRGIMPTSVEAEATEPLLPAPVPQVMPSVLQPTKSSKAPLIKESLKDLPKDLLKELPLPKESPKELPKESPKDLPKEQYKKPTRFTSIAAMRKSSKNIQVVGGVKKPVDTRGLEDWVDASDPFLDTIHEEEY